MSSMQIRGNGQMHRPESQEFTRVDGGMLATGILASLGLVLAITTKSWKPGAILGAGTLVALSVTAAAHKYPQYGRLAAAIDKAEDVVIADANAVVHEVEALEEQAEADLAAAQAQAPAQPSAASASGNPFDSMEVAIKSAPAADGQGQGSAPAAAPSQPASAPAGKASSRYSSMSAAPAPAKQPAPQAQTPARPSLISRAFSAITSPKQTPAAQVAAPAQAPAQPVAPAQAAAPAQALVQPAVQAQPVTAVASGATTVV